MSVRVDELLAEADRLTGKAERLLEEQEVGCGCHACAPDSCCGGETTDDLLTYGERMVGVEFNPSGLVSVAATKQDFADMIDEINQTRIDAEDPEVVRLCSIAITSLETACMYAVKALVRNAE